MANSAYHQPNAEAIAIVVLARQAALREIKQQRKRQGMREVLPMSVLSRMAMEWVEQHPELIAEAAPSPIVQELGLAHRKRRPRNQALPLCISQVQNAAQGAGQ
jgi:hypothetical protein